METTLLNWLGVLDARRYRQHLWCLSGGAGTDETLVDTATARGIATARIPWNRGKPLLRAARAVAVQLAEQRIDILHSHNTYAHVIAALGRRMHPVRTGAMVYVWWKGMGLKRDLLQLADMLALRQFDRVAVHCRATGVETARRGIPPDRLQVVISGQLPFVSHAYAQDRAEQRALLGAASDSVVIVCLARLWREKRQDLILNAFARVHARCPQARLWIVGTGPEEGSLRAQTTALGLSGIVQFLGFREPAWVFAAADIQVSASDMEGVPLALTSGMAAGLPIVATAVGGVPEIIEHERTGLLVEPGREEPLAEALLKLAVDPLERRRLGEAARAFVEVEYSMQRAGAQLEAFYAELMRPAPASARE